MDICAHNTCVPTLARICPRANVRTRISLEKNSPPSISHKPIFSPANLLRLIFACSSIPLHYIYRASFFLAFLAMLRLSNLAPSSAHSFDPLRHLRRFDVSLMGSCLFIHLRWSKTLQRYNQSAHIPLFSIPGSILCPVQAFILLQRYFPVRPADPCLSYRSTGRLFILTQSDIRCVL
jgi:hypothetical protein